jgi:hypothetical protein
MEERLRAGIYSYGATAGFEVRGLPLPNLQRLSKLLGVIMKANGSVVLDAELAAVIGSLAVDQRGLIAVRMTALRRDLALIDGGWPFDRLKRKGWLWSGPEPELEAPSTL